MLTLFAETTEITGYERLFDRYGLPTIILMFIGIFFWKYGRKIIDAHMDFLTVTAQQSDRLAATMDKQTAILADHTDPHGNRKFDTHIFSTVATNKALLHHADAMEVLAEGLGPETAEKITPHVEAIRRVIS